MICKLLKEKYHWRPGQFTLTAAGITYLTLTNLNVLCATWRDGWMGVVLCSISPVGGVCDADVSAVSNHLPGR